MKFEAFFCNFSCLEIEQSPSIKSNTRELIITQEIS